MGRKKPGGDYNVDMAIWMRGAGFPVEEIARQMKTHPSRVGRDTNRAARFSMREWLNFEATLFKNYCDAFDRARTIARGKQQLAAFRRRRVERLNPAAPGMKPAAGR